MSDKVKHSLDFGPLPEELIPIARRQGEDPDTVCNYLEELRNLIFERGDFEPLRTDDEFLIKFLRSRLFNLESAYRLLKNYHEFRESNQDLYQNVDPFALSHLGKDDIVSVAPYLNQNSRRMIFWKIGNWNPSEVPVNDLLSATLVILEMGSLEACSQVLGGVLIFDFEGLTVNHAMTITPSVAKNLMCLIVTSIPCRADSVHVVNQSWAFDMIFKVFKPLLSEKMRSRLFFHGTNMESLHKHIDRESLPTKYGGYMEEYPYTTWLDNLRNDPVVLKEMIQLGYAPNARDS